MRKPRMTSMHGMTGLTSVLNTEAFFDNITHDKVVAVEEIHRFSSIRQAKGERYRIRSEK